MLNPNGIHFDFAGATAMEEGIFTLTVIFFKQVVKQVN